jgi:hypothetical protein
MKKNKKADSSPKYLVGLILALVLIGLFIYIYSSMKGNISEGAIREIRIQNVKNHANAHILGLDLSSELNFPMIRLNVKKEEELKESSKALVHDWSDLLKGRKQLFPKEDSVYCVPGHYLEFKAKDKKIPAMEYIEYQRTHTVDDIGARHITGDSDVPVSEYIRGYTTDKTIFEEEMKALKEELSDNQYVTIVNDKEFFNRKELKEEYAINTGYEYMTVFVYMKKGYWPKWLSSLFGTNVGIVGGVIVGAILIPFTGGGSLVITAVALGGGAAGGVIGYSLGSWKSADWRTGIFLVPNKAGILKDLKCDILPARGEIE